jgi:hypothetical protein
VERGFDVVPEVKRAIRENDRGLCSLEMGEGEIARLVAA